MRIAVIHPSMIPKGGAERVVMWLCDSMTRRGHEVTLITSDYDEYWGSREALAFPVVELGVRGHEWRRTTIADWHAAADRLRPLLDGFDVLNPHNYPAYVWAQWAREQVPTTSRPPILWFCEEPYREFYREITDEHCLLAARMRETDPLLRRAMEESREPEQQRSLRARIVDAAKQTIRPFDRAGLFKQAEAIDREVVPKLDLILGNSRFIASNVRKVFGVAARDCLLGIPVADVPGQDVERRSLLFMVTRLAPAKNVDTCLRAVAELRDRGELPFERFVIAGHGEDKAYLERLTQILGIDDVVDFPGFVSDDEIRELYRTAGVVIYLPLDETFGLPYLEAAEFRKVVIGPNIGGPAELVLDGQTGFTVDPLDVGAVAGAIAAAFADSARAQRFGEAGHSRLLEQFTFEKFVDRFEENLNGLVTLGVTAAAPRGSLCTSDDGSMEA